MRTQRASRHANTACQVGGRRQAYAVQPPALSSQSHNAWRGPSWLYFRDPPSQLRAPQISMSTQACQDQLGQIQTKALRAASHGWFLTVRPTQKPPTQDPSTAFSQHSVREVHEFQGKSSTAPVINDTACHCISAEAHEDWSAWHKLSRIRTTRGKISVSNRLTGELSAPPAKSAWLTNYQATARLLSSRSAIVLINAPRIPVFSFGVRTGKKVYPSSL